MRTKQIILLVCLLFVVVLNVRAQNRYQNAFDSIRIERWKEFNKARITALRNYSNAVRDAWREFKGEPALQEPEEEQVMPVLIEENSAETASVWDALKRLFKKNGKKEPRRAKVKPVMGNGENLDVGKEIAPTPTLSQPQPQYKVDNVPQQVQRPNAYKTYNLFGLDCKIRIGDNCRVQLKSLDSNDVSDAMKEFEEPQFANMLHDCLQERSRHKLSDWAYYLLLQKIVDDFYGKNTNEASLVLAFLYSQSGYKMRMVHDTKRLMMVTACHHTIYGKEYTFADYPNSQTPYYLLDGRKLGATIYICNAKWPKESSMSMQLTAEQEFVLSKAPQRTIRSRKNPDFTFTITSNKNYIDFFNTYPRSYIGNDYMTSWVMYAETPLEKNLRDQLYPAMRKKLEGLSQVEAVRQLLWWIQGDLDEKMTNSTPEYIQYAYDELVWGYDRAFFGEETLFYPWCDCEDRAILFSHLVREVVGLDVALVYYPGHLATAVAFNEPVRGDGYVARDGRHYTVCDPTFLGANIGETMTTVIGKPATLIPLKKN